VLAADGRTKEAREQLQQALKLWTRYGYAVYADRVRAALANR